MKNGFIFLAFVLLVLSCFNEKKRESSENDGEWSVEYYSMEEKDSVEKIDLQDGKEIITKEKKSATSSGAYSTSSSSRSYEESDNMRGFDPASEDDMDDNGMSRYMENTDDEGWD